MSFLKQHIFNFKTDHSNTNVSDKLNNPFDLAIPEIGKLAVQEFQDYLTTASKQWDYDFQHQKGKMFGVLVIQKLDNSYGYLGTVSGKLPISADALLVPAVLEKGMDNPILSLGLSTLATTNQEIKKAIEEKEIQRLKEKRKQHSIALQKQLFEHTQFLNIKAENKNVLQIFEDSEHGYPPAAAGECAAPKLLQYAFRHNLKPVAIAEFWWGQTPKSMERTHKGFYPACKDKCRPILEYMLCNTNLFQEANAGN